MATAPALGAGLVLGAATTGLQDLVGQAQRLAAGGEGQAIVTEVAAGRAAAGQLAQFGVQGALAGEVEFGGVVDEQDDRGAGGHAATGLLVVGSQDGRVGGARMVQQPVQGAQVSGGVPLLGQGAAGVCGEAVGNAHQPLGAAAVPQLGGAEVAGAEVLDERVHRLLPPQRTKGLPTNDLNRCRPTGRCGQT